MRPPHDWSSPIPPASCRKGAAASELAGLMGQQWEYQGLSAITGHFQVMFTDRLVTHSYVRLKKFEVHWKKIKFHLTATCTLSEIPTVR